MGLEAAAKQLAAKGRHGDDVLVHMSRGEVAGLQALAKANGSSLTLNPHTGLPEAFSLRSLLPALAGAAVGFMTANPWAGAATSAGMTKMMGGSNSQALMSGIGGYGGASLGAGLADSAASGLVDSAATAVPGEAASSFADQQVLADMAPAQGADMASSMADTTGAAAQTGPSVEQMTAENQGLEMGDAQMGYTPKEQFANMSPSDKMNQLSNVSLEGTKSAMGGYGAMGKAGLMALAPAMTEQPDAPGAKKLPGNIRPYSLTRQNMSGGAPSDSRERQQLQDTWTAGPVRAAANGGIMRLAAGGHASTTGGYDPSQVYGAGKSGAYAPQDVYGAGAPASQAAARYTPTPMPSLTAPDTQKYLFDPATASFSTNPAWQAAQAAAAQSPTQMTVGYASGGIAGLGGYSDGGRLLRGPGDGVSDSIPATIGGKQPARLANNEFVIPARIVSELGNGSTDAGAKQLYDMMDRIQKRRAKTVGKNKVAVDSKAYKELPA